MTVEVAIAVLFLGMLCRRRPDRSTCPRCRAARRGDFCGRCGERLARERTYDSPLSPPADKPRRVMPSAPPAPPPKKRNYGATFYISQSEIEAEAKRQRDVRPVLKMFDDTLERAARQLERMGL